GEHRVAAEAGGHAGDQLGENDRLAETGTAEEAGFAAADERGEQVDDLNARFEDFGAGRKLGHGWGFAMNGPTFLRIDRAAAVDRIAEQVEHAAQRGLTDRHRYGRARVVHIFAADEAVGAAQGDAAD